MGKHVVYPLHSDITVLARDSGFDNLTPILWYKISCAKYEANTYSTILGKPYGCAVRYCPVSVRP